jgi:type III pantothenate kinase
VQLAIDIGNSYVKYALYKGEELLNAQKSDLEPVYLIKQLYEENPDIGAIIISSVRESLDADTIPIPETIHHVILDHETPIPIKNNYKTGETLGRDRIALAVAAAHKFPDKNVAIVDLGTCMTIDVVNKQSEYLGGIISPGLQMRFEAMHKGTANLPLIKFENQKIPKTIGDSTQSCMESGAAHGMFMELIGTINDLKDEFDSLNVMLTGGDYKVFENELKIDIFADPNLVLRGLNQILLFNIE